MNNFETNFETTKKINFMDTILMDTVGNQSSSSEHGHDQSRKRKTEYTIDDYENLWSKPCTQK
jgi:hypothetical protein